MELFCVVVCHTPACFNEGIELSLLCGEEVYCGECGNEITDKREVTA